MSDTITVEYTREEAVFVNNIVASVKSQNEAAVNVASSVMNKIIQAANVDNAMKEKTD